MARHAQDAKHPQASNARWWRDVSAFLAVLVVAGCVGTGFFFYGSIVQTALVCGLVGGLIASTLLTAGATSGAAALLGALLMPNTVLSGSAVANALMIGVGAAGVAVGARWVLERVGPRAGKAAYWVAIVIVIGNLWVTALTVGTMAGERAPLFQFLERGAAAKPQVDDEFYVRVKNLMLDGKGYYAAYEQGVGETWGGKPGSVFAVRLPTYFWFWAALPRVGAALVVAYLVLATAATLAAARLAQRFVRAPLALVAVAAVDAHFLSRAISRDLTYTEPWIGALVVVIGYFALRALDRPDRNVELAAAAGLATLGTLVRELAAFTLAAGLVATYWVEASSRRRHWLYWGAGTALAVVGYGTHYSRAKGIVDNSLAVSHWLDPGLSNLWLAVSYGGQYQFLGNGPVLPVLLALAGIVGGLVFSCGAARAYIATLVALPLLFIVLASNNALLTTGASTNYWGLIILPMLFALAPSAFAFIPGMRAGTLAVEKKG